MKFLDLFAGIGGFRLGLTRQGHECVGFCEIDKFARKSYKAMYETEGEIEFYDIRQVTDQDFRQLRGQVDIICGDSLARHFHSQADDWDLRILEVLCSSKLLERPNRSNHVFYSWKTSRVYSITTRERHFEQSSLHWMSWGMMSNGRCLTVRTSKSPKTEKGSLLSDILEDTVPDSYFLSEEKVAQLVLND